MSSTDKLGTHDPKRTQIEIFGEVGLGLLERDPEGSADQQPFLNQSYLVPESSSISIEITALRDVPEASINLFRMNLRVFLPDGKVSESLAEAVRIIDL